MVSKGRLTFLFLFFLLCFAAVIFRLFYWQIVRGSELSVAAAKQYNLIYEVQAKRGGIFFRDTSPLVINQPGFLLVGYPHEIQDKKKTAHALSIALDEHEASIASVLENDLFWVPVKHKIDEELKKKVEELKLIGIGFEDEPLRYYPEGSMAAHVVGFVGADVNGNDKGYFGLEGYYDREIRGRGATLKSFIDALGRPILLGRTSREPLTNGRDFILEVDQTVQFIVEAVLEEGLLKYGAKGGTVIVMDPKTGGILAMASRPSYDPFKWGDFDETSYKNPAVADSYEPGSTFKALVMAAALNEDVVNPNTHCDICEGPISIGEFTIRTWNNTYHKDSTMVEVIEHSDNIGMVFVAKKLGLDKLYSYLERFGIGEPTNIDLEDEEATLLREKSQWREIDLATVSFGQGVAVTPIQMIRAISAIANGGKLMEPHVVGAVVKENTEVLPIAQKVTRSVLSEKTAKVMTEMMVNAVDRGEAKFAKPKGYRIAGKTGTAQIPIKGHYDPTKTIASFVGFAPADDPKFAMLVKLDEPQSSPFGSETAAPLFFSIASDLFTYYNIPPSR